MTDPRALAGALLDVVFDLTALGVAVVETESGRLVRLNRTYGNLIGQLPGKLMGTTVLAITHADDLEALVRHTMDVATGRRGRAVLILRRLHPDGTSIRLRTTLSPLPMGDEPPRHHLELIEPADPGAVPGAAEGQGREAGFAERERRITAELEAAQRDLEVFTHGAPHELRAPVRAIDGFIRILEEDHAAELSDGARERLARVREGTRQMERLIDDLLRLSRLTRKSLERALVDMRELVMTAWDALAARRVSRRIELRVGPLPPCEGDATLLYEAILCILANALEFSRCRPVANVEVVFVEAAPDAQPDDSHAQGAYCIRDDGIGFDPRHADQIFHAFKRLHGSDDHDGTGIGLALVQRIVERHGGRVWAESTPGRGAAFYLTLPASRPEGSERVE